MNREKAVLLAAAAALALVPGLACRRPAIQGPRPAAPAAPAATAEHCWWTALRSPLPPDSAAERFVRGFTALGLAGATRTTGTDTTVYDGEKRTWEPVGRYVLAHAGPTRLADDPAGAASEGWAVAWVRNDTTRLRHYLGRTQPLEGGQLIGRCQALWRAAMGSDSLP